MSDTVKMNSRELRRYVGDIVKRAVERHNDSIQSGMDPEQEEQNKTHKGNGNESIEKLISLIQGAGAGNTNHLPQKKPENTLGAITRCYLSSGKDKDKAIDMARKLYGGEGNYVEKALTTSIAADGGLLLHDEFASDVIEMLRPQTAVRQLNPVTMTLDTSTLTQPRLASGAQSEYVGETQDRPASQPGFDDMRLSLKKLRTLVPISNDLIRYGQSSPAAEQIVQSDMIQSMRITEDRKFIRSAGGEATPRGLKYLADEDNLLDVTAEFDLDKVTGDLGRMVLQLLESDVPMLRPGWIMAPRTWIYLSTVRDGNGNFAFRQELAQGTLWNWPVVRTTQIPINLGGGGDESEIYLADFAQVVIGDGAAMEVATSNEASYINAEGDLVSAFGQDVTVVRAISYNDMAARHKEAIVVMEKVDWAAGA